MIEIIGFNLHSIEKVRCSLEERRIEASAAYLNPADVPEFTETCEAYIDPGEGGRHIGRFLNCDFIEEPNVPRGQLVIVAHDSRLGVAVGQVVERLSKPARATIMRPETGDRRAYTITDRASYLAFLKDYLDDRSNTLLWEDEINE
jgi:hypothetical protein